MAYVLGVDEAGRGPLAGPLAVGAVCAPEETDLLTLFPGLNDSKQLTERKREIIYEQLLISGVRFHVELIPAAELDERGLTASIADAVARSVRTLMPIPSGKVWLDGLLKAPGEYEQETVTGGDGIVPAIMLASVAAKVVRDRHMQELDTTYPGYGLAKHKGYGTKAHYEAIRTLGLTPEHRRRFLRNL